MKKDTLLITLSVLLCGCGDRSIPLPADDGGSTPPSFEQEEWAITTGGTGGSHVSDMVVDATGNAFVVGDFSGKVRFGSIEKKAAGEEDRFVARLSPGGAFQWVLTETGSPTLVSWHSVALDRKGRLYVAGVHQGDTKFGDHKLPFRSKPSVFVVRLTAEGQVVWARSFSSQGAGVHTVYSGASIASAGPQGGVVVAGGFEGTLDFDKHRLVEKGQGDLFVASVSPEGECRWAISEGGPELDYAGAVTTDQSGAIYITRPRSIAKLSNGGGFQWNTKSHGISGLATVGGGLIAAGNFGGEVTLGSTTLKTSGSQLSEILVARLSSTGAYMWAIGGGGTDFYDLASDVATEDSGTSYVTGMVGERATFGPHELSGRHQIPAFFVAKLSPAGEPLWAEGARGKGESEGSAVAVNKSSLWTAGNFGGQTSFDSHILESKGPRRLFVWRRPLP
jgi:hypothetical protein